MQKEVTDPDPKLFVYVERLKGLTSVSYSIAISENFDARKCVMGTGALFQSVDNVALTSDNTRLNHSTWSTITGMLETRTADPLDGIDAGVYITLYDGGTTISTTEAGFACCKLQWTTRRKFVRETQSADFKASFTPSDTCLNVYAGHASRTPTSTVTKETNCDIGSARTCIADDGTTCNYYD